MSFLGLTFERRYPIRGMDGDMRAITADEILHMQMAQQAALQNAYCEGRLRMPDLYSLAFGQTNYSTDVRPLDERFADFKQRLAAAVEARKRLS